MQILNLSVCRFAMFFYLVLCVDKIVSDDDEDSTEIDEGEPSLTSQRTTFTEDDSNEIDNIIPALDLSSCSIQISNEKDNVINLKPLAGESGFPRFNSTLNVTIHGSWTIWNYSFNPCVSYSLTSDSLDKSDAFGGGCHNVSICKYNNDTFRSFYYSLAINRADKVKVDIVKAANKSEEIKVFLVYSGIKSQNNTKTRVQLICDPARKEESDGFFNITLDDGHSSVQAELHHACCCVGGCWMKGVFAENNLQSKSSDAEGEIMLMVAGLLVGALMLVALFAGFCYVKRSNLNIYSKLQGINPSGGASTNDPAVTFTANTKDGTKYPDFRDYEPASLSESRHKLIPVLADSNIQIKSVEMGQRLGGGAFCDTHRAKWNEMTVTVKRLTIAIHNNQLTTETMEWMKEEVRFLSQQRHKNIVCVIGLCLDGRLPFLITEYVIGECLKDFLKVNGQSLTWPQKLRLCNQVADGMTFLHSTKPPIIHRDLRCGNLFLSDNDMVKVADFGLIKLLQPMREQCQNDDCSCQRQLSACPARVRWTAPELLTHPTTKEGQDSIITTACDVYSFGLVVWEMVVCRDPFDGVVTELEVIEIVKNGGRPDIPSVDMMPQFKEVMKSCWHQKPEVRPQFKQVATRLKDLIGPAKSHQKLVNSNRQRLQKLQSQEHVVPI